MNKSTATRQVEGTVLHRATREPVSRAHVCLKYKGLRLHADTGKSGNFCFELPSTGAFELYIAKSGFYARNIETDDLPHTVLLTPTSGTNP